MQTLRRLLAPALVLSLTLVCLSGTPARSDTGPWRWPLDGAPRVVRGFDPPRERWQPGHRGADLAAVPGDEVLAAGPGLVGFAGVVAGTPVVTVVHGELRTTYLPVLAHVRRGDPVRPGAVLGVLAEAPRHCAAVPCLHWGLLRGRDYLDPLALLGRGPVRLFPVSPAPP